MTAACNDRGSVGRFGDSAAAAGKMCRCKEQSCPSSPPRSQSDIQQPVRHTAASQTYRAAGHTVRKPQLAAAAMNSEENLSPAEGAQEHEETSQVLQSSREPFSSKFLKQKEQHTHSTTRLKYDRSKQLYKYSSCSTTDAVF